jgi:hypothetical protein
MCLNIEIALALKLVCADLSDKFIQRQILSHSRQGEKRKACLPIMAASGRLLPERIVACLSFPSVTGISSAAHGRVFLCTLLCPNCLPVEDKSSEKSANQDAYNDISVIVHCQQHDKIRYSELQHMQESPYKLLHGVRLAWPDDGMIAPEIG